MSRDDPEQRSDSYWSWNRTDEEFFARGACHVLCAVFLREFHDPSFSAMLILPASGFRGRHVVAASSSLVFDWRGFSPRDAFLAEYSEAYRARYPEWDYSLVSVADAVGDDFCAQHKHRRPDQFLQDPIPRAKAYLQQLLKAAPAP